MTTAARNTYEPRRYPSIPTRNTIRFRNTYNRFRVFLSWVPELLRLQDPRSEAYQHNKSSVYVTVEDIEISKALYKFFAHTIQFVDYFESDNNYQVSSLIQDRSLDRSFS